MELNLRTVLVVLGSLVMLGILFDGFRRMRRARQEALSLDVKGDFKFPEESFSSELPNGGSRVVGVVDAEELLEDAKNFRDQLDGLSGMSALDQLEENAKNELPADVQESLHEERVYAGEPDFQHDSYELDSNDLEIAAPETEASHIQALKADESERESVFQSAQEEALATALLTEKVKSKPQGGVKQEAAEISMPKAKPLDLDEHVPLLMDVEELGEDVEPQLQDVGQNDAQPNSQDNNSDEESIVLTAEDIPSIEASVSDIANILTPEFEAEELNASVDEKGAQNSAGKQVNDGRQEAADMMTQAAYAPVKKPGVNAERLSDRPEAGLVLVTHVVPHDEEGFCGEDILYLVNSCDLRHGEKDIFHRFEQEHGDGNVQFSMANSFNPGVFDPEALLHERIHGLTLFMSLPGPLKAMDAFEAMTEMASVIARNLGGDVHDETHSIMALQTIEHNRQQVRDFVRKQKLAGKNKK
jgi:cell division protein ZipA